MGNNKADVETGTGAGAGAGGGSGAHAKTNAGSGARARNLAYTAVFTALIAYGAYIKIPTPTAPITLQLQFTNLAGLLLGKKYGPAAVLAYIALGLSGVPVFAGGGGPGYVLRPTFGYIAGFLAGAYVAGAIGGRKRTFKNLAAASFANVAIVYAVGMAYYYLISKYYLRSPVAIGTMLIYSFALTAPFDAAFSLLSAKAAARLMPILFPVDEQKRGGAG